MNLITKSFKILFKEGPFVFIKKFFNFIKNRIYGLPIFITPSYYNYVTDFSRPPLEKKKLDQRFRTVDKDRLVINWLIPDMDIGSGGHMTIFRIVKFLEKFGHQNRIYIFGGTKHGSSKKLKKFINKNFIELEAEVYADISEIKDSDALIATSWQTAYPVKAIQNTRGKFYFVQDFEPWFYAMGSEYKFAENTYKFGFYGICAGPWLSKILKEKYQMEGDFFDLAYDSKIYFPQRIKDNLILKSKDASGSKKTITLKSNGKPKIIYYARPVSPRRGFELAVQAFRELYKRGLDFDLSFFGWDISPYIIPFPYHNLRILSHQDLAKLYNWADLGIVFSMSNYSLLPHEMMACQLPVLDLKGPTLEGIFQDGYNISLAEPNPISIADKIEELLLNPEKRKKIADNAYQYVQQFSWEKSAKKVEEILKNHITQNI